LKGGAAKLLKKIPRPFYLQAKGTSPAEAIVVCVGNDKGFGRKGQRDKTNTQDKNYPASIRPELRANRVLEKAPVISFSAIHFRPF
jgi:hypothetical protein